MIPRYTTLDYIRNPFRLIARLRHAAQNRNPLTISYFQNNATSKALMIYNNRRLTVKNVSVVIIDNDHGIFNTIVPVIYGFESTMILFSEFTNNSGVPFDGEFNQLKIEISGHKFRYLIKDNKIIKRAMS